MICCQFRVRSNHKCKTNCCVHWLPLSSIHVLASYYKLCNVLNSLVLNGNTVITTPGPQEKATEISGGRKKQNHILNINES